MSPAHRYVPVFLAFLLSALAFPDNADAAAYKKKLMQHEAAAVYVSVLNAVPFEQYVSELSPAIDYSFSKALEQVAQASSSEAYASRDAFAMMLKLGITDQSALSAKDLAEGAEEKSAGSGTPAAEDLEVGTNMPPMLQYSAAASLYQEIKLLEQSVRKAARKKDYKPYIVRVQISVMPFKRDLPIDVYSTLSFFNDNSSKADTMTVERAQKNFTTAQNKYEEAKAIFSTSQDKGVNGIPKENPQLKQAEKDVVKARKDLTDAIKRVSEDKLPMVVPLIVSENFELEAYSRSAQVYREYGLALVAAYKNMGLKGGLQKVVDQLRKQLGTDYNALLTTARLTDNSIRVRLGAMRSPKAEEHGDAGYEMVPRNHVVSLLLFVPKGDTSGEMRVVANTRMRGEDGALLEVRSLREQRKFIEDKLTEYLLPDGTRIPDKAIEYFNAATSAVLFNNWKGFVGSIIELLNSIKGKYKDDILANRYSQWWTEVASVVEGGQMAYTNFELDPIGENPNPGVGKPILSIGEDHLSATFAGGQDLAGKAIDVTLLLLDGEGPALPAKSIQVFSNGTGFVATFASPKDLGIPTEYIAKDAYAEVTLDGVRPPYKLQMFPTHIKTEIAKDAPVKLTVSTQGYLPLEKDQSTATLEACFSDYKLTDKENNSLVVKLDEAVEVSDAEIKSIDPEGKQTLGAKLENGWRVLSGNGKFRIDLMNLYNGQTFSVKYGMLPKSGKKEVKNIATGSSVIVILSKEKQEKTK